MNELKNKIRISTNELKNGKTTVRALSQNPETLSNF